MFNYLLVRLSLMLGRLMHRVAVLRNEEGKLPPALQDGF